MNSGILVPGITQATLSYVLFHCRVRRTYKRCNGLWLLILHSRKQFVLLADRSIPKQASTTRLQQTLTGLLARSPFSSALRQDSHSVVAFELDWAHTVGLQYENELCHDGKLVMEVHGVTRREFPFVEDARAFYLGSAGQESVPKPTRAHSEGSLESAISAMEQDFPNTDHLHKAGSPPAGCLPRGSPWLGRKQHRSSAVRCLDMASAVQAEAPGSPQGAGSQRSPAAVRPAGSFKDPHDGCQASLGVVAAWARHTEEELPCGSPTDSGKAEGATAVQRPASSSPRQAQASAATLEPAVEAVTSPYSTSPTCTVYKYATVEFSFSDPWLPSLLRPAIRNDEHLLKLYESGLPSWAIFLGTYTTLYRPWFRKASWLLFVAFSLFSMTMGFYDLYKHVPYVQQVLKSIIGALPTSTLFEWLENHAQIRLSILLTFLFGKSVMFQQLAVTLKNAGQVIEASLQPLVGIVGPPLRAACLVCQQGGTQLWLLICTLFGPPLHAFWTLLVSIASLLLPVVQVLKAIVMGPVNLLLLAGEYLGAGAVSLWTALSAVGLALGSTARAVRSSMKLAPTMTAAAKDMHSQGSWWAVMQSDAAEVVRISMLKVFRALQTLARLCAHFGQDILRHRLTLTWKAQRLGQQMAAWLANVWQKLQNCIRTSTTRRQQSDHLNSDGHLAQKSHAKHE